MTASPSKLKVLDLFSGIGGFSLGLERTGGFETVAFCEICPKARKVLRKHWADVPIYEDIKTLTHEQLESDGIIADCVVGGFPCQDISTAGNKQDGIHGSRSGLWAEMFRLIIDVRPAWSIIENVSALRSKGLALVLQNLSEIGMYVEWHCIPASAVGAPHQRDRIWIVAYPACRFNIPIIRETLSKWKNPKVPSTKSCCRGDGGDTLLSEVSDEERPDNQLARSSFKFGNSSRGKNEYREWPSESKLDRVVDGIPPRLDKHRLKQLGNAVVPQIPELLGNAILEVNNV